MPHEPGRPSQPITSFPAQMSEDCLTGEPVMIEVHNNGYTYVRKIRADDLPGIRRET